MNVMALLGVSNFVIPFALMLFPLSFPIIVPTVPLYLTENIQSDDRSGLPWTTMSFA